MFRISIWNVNFDQSSNGVWNYIDDSNCSWQQWATIVAFHSAIHLELWGMRPRTFVANRHPRSKTHLIDGSRDSRLGNFAIFEIQDPKPWTLNLRPGSKTLWKVRPKAQNNSLLSKLGSKSHLTGRNCRRNFISLKTGNKRRNN